VKGGGSGEGAEGHFWHDLPVILERGEGWGWLAGKNLIFFV
jgi:hypothetical protein